MKARLLPSIGLSLLAASTPMGHPQERTAKQWIEQGHLYLSQQELGKAKKAFQRAIAREGANADAHVGLAIALRMENVLGKALDTARKAVQLDPALDSGRYLLGQILLDVDRPDEAMQQADWLLQSDATRFLGHYLAAEAMLSEDEAEKAAEHLEAALPLAAPEQQPEVRLMAEALRNSILIWEMRQSQASGYQMPEVVSSDQLDLEDLRTFQFREMEVGQLPAKYKFTVRIGLLIDANGALRRARVFSCYKFRNIGVEEYVAGWYGKAQYKAAQARGKAVPSWMTVHLHFSRN